MFVSAEFLPLITNSIFSNYLANAFSFCLLVFAKNSVISKKWYLMTWHQSQSYCMKLSTKLLRISPL